MKTKRAKLIPRLKRRFVWAPKHCAALLHYCDQEKMTFQATADVMRKLFPRKAFSRNMIAGKYYRLCEKDNSYLAILKLISQKTK